MGKYTQHWAEYRRASHRRTLQLLGVLACLPVIAAVGYGLSVSTSLALPVLGVLLITWLVVLVRLSLRSTQVPCPQCNTVYSRGKYLSNCPKCGLRMLQEDPG